MKLHPDFDPAHPEKLCEFQSCGWQGTTAALPTHQLSYYYSQRTDTDRIAYDYANEMVEARFQHVCASPCLGLPITCVDGTGTHVHRQIRRMNQAREAGFFVVKLYVKVSVDTALARNAKRQRRVPDDILRRYVAELDQAVQAVVDAGVVDELVSRGMQGGLTSVGGSPDRTHVVTACISERSSSDVGLFSQSSLIFSSNTPCPADNIRQRLRRRHGQPSPLGLGGGRGLACEPRERGTHQVDPHERGIRDVTVWARGGETDGTGQRETQLAEGSARNPDVAVGGGRERDNDGAGRLGGGSA